VKSYVRNIINLSCAKILLTSVINLEKLYGNALYCRYHASDSIRPSSDYFAVKVRKP